MKLLLCFSYIVRRLLLIFFVFIPTSAFGERLKIVVGLERPPYILQATNSGYELELLSQVIELMGYSVKYIYVPYGRSQKLLSDPDIDGITTMTADTEANVKRLTDSYVTYHNSVVSLAEKKLKIRTLSDLSGVGVISFHNAKALLGDKYHDAVVKNSSYLEIAKQSTQVKLFLKDRVDCIVIDKNIFNYFFKQLGVNKQVVFHNLFPPIDYQMVFKDPKLVKSFNKHLIDFKKTEKYHFIHQKYLSDPI
jgi:polar amino acid transport system substrate-binding protein